MIVIQLIKGVDPHLAQLGRTGLKPERRVSHSTGSEGRLQTDCGLAF
jgi:hypothetical protein